MNILVGILQGLFVIVAVFMVFFILLQEGKGGGLAGLGGTKAAGVEGVTNPIRRATAVLAVIFFLLAVLIGFLSREPGRQGTGGIFDKGGAAAATQKQEETAGGSEATEAATPEEKVPAKGGAGAAKEQTTPSGKPEQGPAKAEEQTSPPTEAQPPAAAPKPEEKTAPKP